MKQQADIDEARAITVFWTQLGEYHVNNYLVFQDDIERENNILIECNISAGKVGTSVRKCIKYIFINVNHNEGKWLRDMLTSISTEIWNFII